MSAQLDQEEKVEQEEDRIAQEYLDAGNGQLQLLPVEPVPLDSPERPSDMRS
jgi:hypothetical protein